MRWKRYAVTVSDNWTPVRTFWTLEAAKKFYRPKRDHANVFVWKSQSREWEWICGARDLVRPGD